MDGVALENPRRVITGPGDQTAPSLSAGRLAYLDGAVARLATVDGDLLGPLSSVDGLVGWPSLRGDFASYRSYGTVHVVDLAGPSTRGFTLGAEGLRRTVLGSEVVAWEVPDPSPSDGGGDVGWTRLADGPAGATTARLPGTQGAVATAGRWVAWIAFDAPAVPGDASSTGTAAGAIHLLDTVSGVEAPVVAVPNGTARGVDALVDLSLDLPPGSTAPRLAVTVLPYGGGDSRHVVVLDAAGAVLARLAGEGDKLNPRLVGGLVGFEDFSLGSARVVLWDWAAPVDPVTGPVLHVPSVSGEEQRLHDIEVYAVAAGERIRVAWAEASQLDDLDVWLYDAALPLDGDVDRPDVPAQCDDVEPVLLGDPPELVATRLTSKPKAYGGRVVFDAPVNVLVCMDGVDVTAAGVVVGTRVVAGTEDFGRGEVHREARIAVPAGEGAIGAVVAGKPGSSLRVRVLRDGEVPPAVPPDLATCAADGTCPPPPPGLTKGCTSSGGAGGLALLLFPALLLARRRRS